MATSLLPTVLGPSARLEIAIAWGANLLADPATWTWTDITTDVRQDPGISFEAGRGDEASTSQPAQCTLLLDNTDRAYSLGGQSPNYPNVRRGTPVRIRINPNDGGGYRVAFFGFADGFSPSWDSLTGRIPVVALSASGTLRRLSQGLSPVQSAFRRAMEAEPTVVAYWPFEEADGATLAKNLRGGADMTFSEGEPKFGSDDSFDASAPLVDLGSAHFTAAVNPYPNTGQSQVRFLIKVPDDGLDDGTVLAHVAVSGSLSRFDLVYEASGTGDLSIFIYNRDGSLNRISGAWTFDMNGKTRRLTMEFTQSGPNVLFSIGTIAPTDLGAGYGGETIPGTVGAVTQIEVNPHGTADGVIFGHLTVQNTVNSIYEAEGPLQAFAGEFITSSTPGVSRLERLADEAGLRVTRYTPVGQFLTEYDRIGPQRVAPLLDLLRDCETADQGQLWDGRDAGLSYSTRRYREEGPVKLTINAGTGQLHGSFEAVDDDQRTRNKVTAQRYHGVAATFEDVSGPMGTAVIGTYDSSIDINVFHDLMAIHHAAWQVHLGTVPGYRYPTVTIDVRAAPGLGGDALDIVPGDRIDVTNIDDALLAFPSGTVSLIVEGIAHAISASDGWTVTFRCSPFSPWGIARAGAPTGDASAFVMRTDTAGSSMSSSKSAGSTTLAVTTPAGPRWTTRADDFPLTLDVGGLQVRATSCSGTGTAQTFTIDPLPLARSAGTSVKLHDPRPLGL